MRAVAEIANATNTGRVHFDEATTLFKRRGIDFVFIACDCQWREGERGRSRSCDPRTSTRPLLPCGLTSRHIAICHWDVAAIAAASHVVRSACGFVGFASRECESEDSERQRGERGFHCCFHVFVFCLSVNRRVLPTASGLPLPRVSSGLRPCPSSRPPSSSSSCRLSL